MSNSTAKMPVARTPRRLRAVALILSVALPVLPVIASIQREPPRMEEPRLAAGKYLVASESMPDPRFRQTVILVVKHDAQGSLGVIVNQPSQVPLSEVVDGGGPGLLYFGGPVQTRVLSMLFRSDETPGTATPDEGEGPEIVRVIGKVGFILGFQAVVDLHARLGDQEPRRVYAGYAGWSAGQLKAEIDNGGWYLVADSDHPIFSERPESVWGDLVRKLRGRWA